MISGERIRPLGRLECMRQGIRDSEKGIQRTPSAPKYVHIKEPPCAPTNGDEPKLGRPEKWTPRKISREDREMESQIIEELGPETSASDRFLKKYETFCQLNELDPRLGLLKAIAQARVNKAAFSSLKTEFQTLIKRRVHAYPAEEAWRALRIIQRGAAEADPVQPRLTHWTREQCSSEVSKIMKAGEIPECAFVWFAFATGNRCANIVLLKGKQVIIGEDQVTVQWRWRKASEKEECVYLFSWSMKPPQKVVAFFKKAPPDELLWIGDKYKSRGGIAAATLTKILRSCSGDQHVTSYVFRDHLCEMLRSLGLLHLVKSLLDHAPETDLKNYQQTPLNKSINERVRSVKEESRERAIKKKKYAKKALAARGKKKMKG